MLCRGCDGCCVFCLYCVTWSCRCSCMGRVSVSSCRCCMFVSCVHPVAVLNAAFCMTCSLIMLFEDAIGDHTEEAYSKGFVVWSRSSAFNSILHTFHPDVITFPHYMSIPSQRTTSNDSCDRLNSNELPNSSLVLLSFLETPHIHLIICISQTILHLSNYSASLKQFCISTLSFTWGN